MSFHNYSWVLDNTHAGWTRRYDSESELLSELRRNICEECYRGTTFIDTDFETGEDLEAFVNPPDPHSVDDLLRTPCGKAFEVTLHEQ